MPLCIIFLYQNHPLWNSQEHLSCFLILKVWHFAYKWVSAVPGIFSSPWSIVNKAVSNEVCELALMPNLDPSAKSVSKEALQKQSDANYCCYKIHMNASFSHELKAQPAFKTMRWCRFWTFWVVLHDTALRDLSHSTL